VRRIEDPRRNTYGWKVQLVRHRGKKHKSRKFSVARYGEEDAKARAIQARQEAMAVQQPQPYVPQVKHKPKPLRPPRAGRSRVVAELDEEQLEWLTALAVERGVSRSDLLNLIIGHIRADTDQAAIDYRAALLHKLPMANFAVEWRTAKRSRNKSGIVGVCRLGGEEGYRYWVAQWTDADGKKHRKQFAMRRLGEEPAKALALQSPGGGHERGGRGAGRSAGCAGLREHPPATRQRWSHRWRIRPPPRACTNEDVRPGTAGREVLSRERPADRGVRPTRFAYRTGSSCTDRCESAGNPVAANGLHRALQ
jgi:hypothetical protein